MTRVAVDVGVAFDVVLTNVAVDFGVVFDVVLTNVAVDVDVRVDLEVEVLSFTTVVVEIAVEVVREVEVVLPSRFFKSDFCSASSTTLVANCGSRPLSASMAFLPCSNTPSRYLGARLSSRADLTDSSGSHRTTSSMLNSFLSLGLISPTQSEHIERP